ncbi:MAG: outer membrane lipoprotein-sorting protein [Myxococcota bacterium]
MTRHRCSFAAVGLLLFASSARAEETAAEISRKARERGALNLVGLTAKLKLVTTSKDGKVKEQELTTSSKKIGERAHTLSRFVKPAGVAGVAVLTVEGKGEAGDDISLYLPRLRRVRKVATSERGKAFMDTDFSYSDLGSAGARDEDVRRLEDQKVDGREAYVLQGNGGEASPYGQVVLYVDKETYVPLKAEYADKGGKPFKAYRSLRLKKFKDRVLAAESSMENLQTGSKTTVHVLELSPCALGDEAFSERALERG